MTRRVLLGMGLLLCVAPRAARADDAALTVFAASSLTEVLTRIADMWTAEGHPRVVFSFDASSRLARQVEQGAPADVYVSADARWMTYLSARGLVAPRVDLAGNALVAVVPVGSSVPVRSAADLARAELRRIALGGENVPVGTYARASLSALGVLPGLQPRIVSGDDARAVLAWVASGEADAGVVYATDARVESRVRVAFTLPPASHPPIVYAGAVVRGSALGVEGAAFLAYCRSEAARRVFQAAGFTPPPSAP